MDMENTKMVAAKAVKTNHTAKSLVEVREGDRIQFLRSKLAISDRYGIDAISIPGSAGFGIESVLSSAIFYGDGVIFIGKSEHKLNTKKILGTYKIPFYEVYAETNITIIDELVSVLHTSRRYKHLVLSVNTLNNDFYDLLDRIAGLHQATGIQIICDFNGSLINISAMPDFCDIDCMVFAIEEFGSGMHLQNIVLAHRRFLTSCEGQSHTVSLDLYSAWRLQFENSCHNT